MARKEVVVVVVVVLDLGRVRSEQWWWLGAEDGCLV